MENQSRWQDGVAAGMPSVETAQPFFGAALVLQYAVPSH